MEQESVRSHIVDLVKRASASENQFSPSEAIAAASIQDLTSSLYGRLSLDAGSLLGYGTGASPGTATGRLVTTNEQALRITAKLEPVILVRDVTGPEDIQAMQSAVGIVTARGGLSSHGAVVARGWGLPAVVGVNHLSVNDQGITLNGQSVSVGEWISIDGVSGVIQLGACSTQRDNPEPEIATLLSWADNSRAEKIQLRANADDESNAELSKSLGAKGIGLCRTEHMFFSQDRLPLLQDLILQDKGHVDTSLLTALEAMQQQDFESILVAMDGQPVCIRLLDPPLHEFLPSASSLIALKEVGDLDQVGQEKLAAILSMQEHNPMLGTRGVRLSIARPWIYSMQVRALAKAAAAVTRGGHHPNIEIMIPLVADKEELRLACDSIRAIESELRSSGLEFSPFNIGVMIETPRAALLADTLAPLVDFISLGTNDLTQLCWGLSRDDVDSELIPNYQKAGVLSDSPFEVLDENGVGFLIRHAVHKAREANPNIKIGVCGEHAGDPRSIRFLVASGINYLSCSPRRLPITRLAVAQALLSTPDEPLETINNGIEPFEIGHKSTPDLRFSILHSLKLTGFGDSQQLAEMICESIETVEAELQQQSAAGYVRFLDPSKLWQLTPQGKDQHLHLLPELSEATKEACFAVYQPFIDLNLSFKQLCTRWQVRGESPNDHEDQAYDDACIDELEKVHLTVEPILNDFCIHFPRFNHYGRRLSSALKRVQSGELDAFTGVRKQSYHDIWMELHGDLITILDIDRVAEGSF